MSKRNIGQPVERVEGHLKVTGQADYTTDISLPDMVHAVVIESTIASGRIIHIDTSAVESAPGVLAVLTHLNAPRLAPAPLALISQGRQALRGAAGQALLPLQDDRIYYYGQHIGLVVAETLEQATYAAGLLKVEYESAEPVADMAKALPQAFIPEDVWGQASETLKGNVEQGLAEAQCCVDATYTTAIQHHVTMEPHSTVAAWENEKLTLYESTTWVYGVRKTVAAWFNLPEEHIRVLQNVVGGSFGAKGPTWPHVALTVMGARLSGRPVKLVLSRGQTFTSNGYRPEIQQHLQLGATSDGHLTAIIQEATVQSTTHEGRPVAPVTKTTRKLYACPNIATSYRLAPYNLPGPFTMRGPGESPGLFAVESAMDELASALQLDPLVLRLRNYAETDPEEDLPWSSKTLRECYLQGAEHFGWSRRDPCPRAMRCGNALAGWGMATMAYDAKVSPASASACLSADGDLMVQSATTDQGTGSLTIMRQIAADTLELPLERVCFALGDTRMPFAPISAGSMTAASIGSATQKAVFALRQKLLNMTVTHPASPFYARQASELMYADGCFSLKMNPGIEQHITDILKLYEQDTLEVVADVQSEQGSERQSHYSFGAHFAEVHVDQDSGEVRVTRYVASFGAGRILNPKTARSQLIGGIVWGIGMALMEQTVLDPRSGSFLNTNFADYQVPVNADIPEIEAFFVEEHDPYVNPLGVKGLGEDGTIGSAAAIANAVYHATGKRIRNLPITPDKILCGTN